MTNGKVEWNFWDYAIAGVLAGIGLAALWLTIVIAWAVWVN